MDASQALSPRPVLESLCRALLAECNMYDWHNFCVAFRPFGLFSCDKEVQRRACEAYLLPDLGWWDDEQLEDWSWGQADGGERLIFCKTNLDEFCVYNDAQIRVHL